MSRRRRRPPARPPRAATPPPVTATRRRAPRRGPLTWAVTVVVLVVLAIGAGWTLRGRGPHAGDPLQALDPVEAYRTAVRLSQDSRFVESLPYYRRALADSIAAGWQQHYAYATALYDVTLGYRTVGSVQLAQTRSSDERVALMREALAQLARAASLAPDSRTLAMIQGDLARMSFVWGFPWDAFIAYRRAQGLAPGDRSWATQGDGFMRLLQHPEREQPLAARPDTLAVRTGAP